MPNVPLHRLAAVISTAATAAASWAVVTQVAGVQLTIRFPHTASSSVGLARTVAASVVAAVAGWAFLAVVQSRLHRPRRSWVATAGAVLAASMILPVGFATTTAAMVSLIAIHLAVGAVAMTGLAATAPALRTASRPAAAPEGLLHRTA